MKDMLGTEVEVGDIILSAGTATGRSKIGQVYGFDKNGWPMMKSEDFKWNPETRAYDLPFWKKSSAGFHVLVLGRERLAQMQPTKELWAAINQDWDASAPPWLG